MILTITLNPTIDKTFCVDRVVAEKKLQARDVRKYPGGGGINVARAVRNLEGESLALWSGGGPTASDLHQLLDEDGVAQRMIEIEGEVRENLVVSQAEGEEQYRFGMPGPTLTRDDLGRWKEVIGEVLPRASYIVVSGSLPGDTELGWFSDLLQHLEGGVPLVVDTKGAPLQCAVDAGVFLIKPNVHELERLVDRDLEGDDQVIEAARELVQEERAQAVLVSVGRAGAFLVTANQALHLSSPSVPVKSKVGAGDSMVGGLVRGLDLGESLEQAARRGVAAGAAAVMTSGTELCRLEDVDRLLDGVRCHPTDA